MQDVTRDGLDFLEKAVQPDLFFRAEVKGLAITIGMLIEFPAELAVGVGEFDQAVVQFLFTVQGDVVAFADKAGVVALPIIVKLLDRQRFLPRQGELERRVDAFQGLIQVAHEDHAVVVFRKDLAHLIAQVIDQDHPRHPQGDQEDDEREHGDEDAVSKGHAADGPWQWTITI